MQPDAPYALRLDVDYPDEPRNRVTVAFRIFTVIPIAIVLAAVSGGTLRTAPSPDSRTTVIAAGGLLFLAPLLMILFRQKYPRWWFDLEPSALPVQYSRGRLPRPPAR